MNITIPKIKENTLVLPKAKEVLKILVLVALARTQIFGMSPQGVAFAATFLPYKGWLGLVGLCFGTANFGISSLRYILTFFIYYIFIRKEKFQTPGKRAFCLGASALATGVGSLIVAGGGMKAVLCIAEAFLEGALYYLFTFLDKNTPVSSFARILIFAGILSGIDGAVIPYANISLSAFCAIFAALSFSYACKISVAMVVSGILAFVMTASGGDAISSFGVFAISAGLGSILAEYGKIGVAVGFLSGLCIGVLYGEGLGGLGVFDMLAPLFAFSILPENLHYKISGFINRRFEPDFYEDEEGTEIHIVNQLKNVAGAVCELADGVWEDDGHGIENKKEIFDLVCSRVCTCCSLYENCKKDKTTEKNIDEIWKVMENDGYCQLSNMPIGFGQICLKAERFLNEFSHIYELYKQNAILVGAAKSSREIMARQYSEISKVIERLSAEIESGYLPSYSEERIYSPKVTVRCEAKTGQTVSGDTVIYFEKDNKFFVILCDGMGSGDEAFHQSRLTARLFEKFLKAGFDKETSLRMINSALVLKADRENFSTVDILEIDTRTGETEFLKVGSAQSILKKKKDLQVFSSKALPVGIIENIDISPIRCIVENGDIILMMTDGISEAASGVLKNDWIKKILALEKRKPWELADLIICGAKARAKFCDDMTCCVIKIERRKEE